jgi:hypothetical protein
MPFQLLLTSFLLYLENLIFLWQFAFFNSAPGHLWNALTPALGFLTLHFFPTLRTPASLVNPATQIICYVPLVVTMIRSGTSVGVSLFGQHLNLCGSLWGFAMCGIMRACSAIDWLFYAISVVQALAVFVTALYFGEFRILDRADAAAGARGDGAGPDLLRIEAGGDEEESA